MRRNLAQSLFQFGQVKTTLIKAKEVRPFVEKLITLARRNTLASRQRLFRLLGDRASIGREDQEKYDAMSRAQQRRVLVSRSGRRHRTGTVPASYNKSKFPFVAKGIVHQLITEVAPRFKDRPGGYTRIIRLAERRIGDDSDLALLQLVGEEGTSGGAARKSVGRRRQKTEDRIAYLEGKAPKRRAKPKPAGRKEPTSAAALADAPPTEPPQEPQST